MKSNPIIIRKNPALSAGGTGRGARVAIPGVFPSASRFGEQVVKLRVPSLDTYIGGGIPIGSVCVIKDEFPSKFGDMVLKSFVADGASYNHRLYICTGSTSPQQFSKDLPSIKKSSSDGNSKGHQMGDDDMSAPDLKIAWRYGHQGGGGSAGVSSKLGDQHQPTFDFSKKVSAEELGGKNVHLSKVCEDDVTEESNFKLGEIDPIKRGKEILKEIIGVVQDLQLDLPKPPSNICRIVISHCEEEVLSGQFLMGLRSIVQHTNSCAIIVMSDTAFKSKMVSGVARARLEHLADIVINLQTVVDQKRRNELGGIDGVCEIAKLASNNTLKIVEPPKDIGFSFKKKRLIFHELHLPPEGENTTQRESSSSSSSSRASSALLPQSSSSSCGSTIQGKRIDF